MSGGQQRVRILSITALSLWPLGCGAYRNLLPSDGLGAKAQVRAIDKLMTIEGTIVEVMESWPLQLSVETRAGRYHVELLDETRITQEGRTASPGSLTPNLRIRVKGSQSSVSHLAMSAQEIEILR